MLRKTAFYNQVSEELLPKKLPKGTVVMYEYVGAGEVNFNNNTREIPPLPACVQTPATSMFFDKIKNEWIPLAFIKRITERGEIEFYNHELLPKDMGCYVTITIGNGQLADDLYDYFELSSFVAMEGKEIPLGARVLYKKVESDKEANKSRLERKRRKEATDYACSLDSMGINRAALLLGFYSSTTDENIIMDKIEEFAEKNPEAFFERVVNDTHGNTKATILHAIQLGVVKVQDNAIVWADSKAAICTLSSNTDAEIQFANWVHESPENLKTYGIIEDVIAKKIAKKAPKKA